MRNQEGLLLDAKKGFQRNFMIFGIEDPGFEAGQKPSGYVRLEVRDGRGKLFAAVQNLRPGNGRFIYKLHLLRSGKDSVDSVTAGELVAGPNKSELEWSFDPSNVGAAGHGIDEYLGAVVLVEYADRPADNIICPLAAYKNGKIEWRNGLKQYFLQSEKKMKQTIQYQGQPQLQQPHQSQFNQSQAAQEKPSLEQTAHGQPLQSQQSQEQPQQDTLMQEQSTQAQPAAEQLYQAENPYPDQAQVNQPQYIPSQPDTMQGVPLKYDLVYGTLPVCSQTCGIPQEYGQQPMEYQQIPATKQNQTAVPYQTGTGQVNTGCVYLNGNMCGAFVNNDVRAVNPCDACKMRHAAAMTSVSVSGDIALLREEIGRYFEECDPFHSKRSDYIWWKVTNPVNLNNILYQCNIRSPLLFNPVVMMAHYKYRHLIIGIFKHKESQKQYVVCGVPGMHMVDRKPFGEMSRWVQAEGNRSRYGAFGYWLVYIDPEDGKILNLI